MSCISESGLTICGNFSDILPEKPKNFDYSRDAKWLEPYPEKRPRIKIGKTTCDCKVVEVSYQPYYGIDVYHSDDCAIVRRVKEHPQLLNLPAFYNYDVIWSSE
jgi:hypothetical protein